MISKLNPIARNLGLLQVADKVRYGLTKWQTSKPRATFRKENPQVKLPPDYLMYESFQLDYQKYFYEGRQSAEWIAELLGKHTDLSKANLFDWGCGPARILRHMPDILGADVTCFGTDYNPASIEWCKANLPNINFNLNTLEASLPYPDDTMNAIYGISIFTHLSEPAHKAWFEELTRVLAPGGVLLITTMGENFRTKMTEEERSRFDKGELIVRGQVKEGHRTFSAFQPKAFMHNLIGNTELLEHIVRDPESGKAIPQDVWIVRKR